MSSSTSGRYPFRLWPLGLVSPVVQLPGRPRTRCSDPTIMPSPDQHSPLGCWRLPPWEQPGPWAKVSQPMCLTRLTLVWASRSQTSPATEWQLRPHPASQIMTDLARQKRHPSGDHEAARPRQPERLEDHDRLVLTREGATEDAASSQSRNRML